MLNKRLAFLSVFASSFMLVACGGGELTLQVLAEGGDELQPVADLPIELLPFDRDSLFAELAADADSPEPQVPADLRQEFDEVLALQETWRAAESEWSELRDELRTLSDRLRGMDQRAREYRQLFEQFNTMESRVNRLDRERQAAFDEFTARQTATQTRMDSVRAVIEAWEDVAFQDYTDIEAQLLEALGREIFQDTTDASGFVTRRLPSGTWWAHARVAIPAGELYWNVPTEATGDTLRLSPDNAERRLAF